MKRLTKMILVFIILFGCVAESAQIQLTKNSQLAQKSDGLTFATNTETGETLLVISVPSGNSASLFGKIFNSRGKFITSFVALAEASAQPSVAYNPVSHEYLLSYSAAC